MFTNKLIFLLFAITLATSFQYGYQSGVINQPLNLITDFIGNISVSRYGRWDEGYKTTVASFCVTSFIVGGLFGALFSGILGNKLGRRKSILWLTVPCLLGTLLVVLCKILNSFEVIIVGRLLMGFSCGAYTAIAPIYLSEVSPASARGIGGVLNQVMIVISVVVSQILGLPSLMNTDILWPYLLGISGIPCIFGAVSLMFCPESPRYLFLVRKDIEGAARALKLLRSPNEDIKFELAEFSEESASESEKAGLMDILKVPHLRLALMVAVVAHCGQQLSGMNGLLFYSVELFKSGGLSIDAANYATIGIGCVLLVITIVSIFVIDRVGRRVLMVGGLFVVLACLIVFTASMIIRQQTHINWPVYVAIASIYIFVCGFGIGAGSIPWFLVVEMFSQENRDAATAVGVTVNWTCVIIIGLGFIQLVKYVDVYVFLPSACIEAVVIFILYKYMPETMGRTPKSIEDEFRHKLLNNQAAPNLEEAENVSLHEQEQTAPEVVC